MLFGFKKLKIFGGIGINNNENRPPEIFCC
jgi:hypothetical protein